MALDLLIEESTYHRRLKIAPVYLIDVSIRQLIRPQTAGVLFVSVCLLFHGPFTGVLKPFITCLAKRTDADAESFFGHSPALFHDAPTQIADIARYV